MEARQLLLHLHDSWHPRLQPSHPAQGTQGHYLNPNPRTLQAPDPKSDPFLLLCWEDLGFCSSTVSLAAVQGAPPGSPSRLSPPLEPVA